MKLQAVYRNLKSLLKSANVVVWAVRLEWDLFGVLTGLGFRFCKENIDLQFINI